MGYEDAPIFFRCFAFLRHVSPPRPIAIFGRPLWGRATKRVLGYIWRFDLELVDPARQQRRPDALPALPLPFSQGDLMPKHLLNLIRGQQ
jgi:hypothetical protein